MNLLPFKKIRFESSFSFEQIKESLQSSVSKSDWNISLDKVMNNRILEGEVLKSSFLIVMGKYGLTYGRTSLLPIMKGNFYFDKAKSKTIINIIIRPFKTGIIILSFFYLLLILGLFFNINKLSYQFIIVACIFFTVTYSSLINKFNKEAKFYEDFIRLKLSAERV